MSFFFKLLIGFFLLISAVLINIPGVPLVVWHAMVALSPVPPWYVGENQNEESHPISIPSQSSQDRPNEIGPSVQGRPIKVLYWGEGKSCIYILGAIHGNEMETPKLVEYIWGLLQRQKPFQELKTALTIIMIPSLNPDGIALKRRTNANGVDLNRNFPTPDFKANAKGNRYYGGWEKTREPEILALLRLCEIHPPALIYSIHQPLNLINYDGPAKMVALDISRINDMRIKADIGYSTPGSLGTFFGKVRHIPVITLELPRTRTKNWEEVMQLNGEAVLYSIQAWVARQTTEPVSGLAPKRWREHRPPFTGSIHELFTAYDNLHVRHTHPRLRKEFSANAINYGT